jgi:glutathione synthase/RimK-type ligase-like ATP-grasp enzyme
MITFGFRYFLILHFAFLILHYCLTMNKICFLSMDDLAGYVSDDELAIEPLGELGWDVHTISWRDKTVNWDDFVAVIIRTTWDYQKFPHKFLEVLRKIDASKARLENPLQIVEWNLSKLYLHDLEQNGVKIVPTIWDEMSVTAEKFSEWCKIFQTDEIIIKPLISATAGYTYRLNNFAPALTDIFTNRPFMVQKFIPNVVSEGEFSLFYFGENYSHTILKTPQPHDFRVQEEHGGIITAVKPSAKLLNATEKVLSLINPRPLYARIDFVRDENDDFCLMELELIEPALYLRMDENAPHLFAKTVDKWLSNK